MPGPTSTSTSLPLTTSCGRTASRSARRTSSARLEFLVRQALGQEAQPLGERGEHGEGEVGAAFHQLEEGGTRDRQELAVGLGDRAREARRLVDERRLAERPAGSQALDYLAADRDGDPPRD